jgi:hypothetical protein
VGRGACGCEGMGCEGGGAPRKATGTTVMHAQQCGACPKHTHILRRLHFQCCAAQAGERPAGTARRQYPHHEFRVRALRPNAKMKTPPPRKSGSPRFTTMCKKPSAWLPPLPFAPKPEAADSTRWAADQTPNSPLFRAPAPPPPPPPPPLVSGGEIGYPVKKPAGSNTESTSTMQLKTTQLRISTCATMNHSHSSKRLKQSWPDADTTKQRGERERPGYAPTAHAPTTTPWLPCSTCMLATAAKNTLRKYKGQHLDADENSIKHGNAGVAATPGPLGAAGGGTNSVCIHTENVPSMGCAADRRPMGPSGSCSLGVVQKNCKTVKTTQARHGSHYAAAGGGGARAWLALGNHAACSKHHPRANGKKGVGGGRVGGAGTRGCRAETGRLRHRGKRP